MKWVKVSVVAALLVAAGAAAAIYWRADNEEQTARILSEDGGFSGIVTDGQTGESLDAARVIAKKQDETFTQSECDENGAFSLVLPNGSYIVETQADGYVSSGRNDAGRTISIRNGTRYINAKLELWPAAHLKGRVVSSDVGIRGEIEVRYISDNSGASNYEFKTITSAEDGSFQLSGLYGGTIAVRVASEGFAAAHLRDIIIQPGETTDLGDIPLRDGITLYGTVTDANSGSGISGATIVIRNARNQEIERAVSSADGSYRLPPVESANVMLTVSADGYYTYRQRMSIRGAATQETSFKLDRAWGLVLDIQNKTGRSPDNTHIKITDISSSQVVYDGTHENGRITLDQLKAGPYLIEATSGDHMVTQSVRANAGQHIRIILKPLARITGHARNSDGSPLTKGEYRYIQRDPDTKADTENPWIALVAPDFEIDDLPAGTYRLELRGDNQRIVSSPEFVLRNGDIRDMTMQLTEGGVLQGRVVSTESGVGVVATVELIADKTRTVKTDNEGNFTIDKLPQEAFSITIKPDREQDSKTFDNIRVRENDTVQRTFQVDAPNTERRARRRAAREAFQNGEMPPPPWGDGKPPWGDGPPPWMQNRENGENPTPPWGDGPPPWMKNRENGENPTPPWGDGPPPWMQNRDNGGNSAPPWGDGQPPWMQNRDNGGNPAPPRMNQNDNNRGNSNNNRSRR